MTAADNKLTVHLNLEIDAHILETVVTTAKQLSGRDARGHYRVDTADLLADLVSRFLVEKGFDRFVADTGNYKI